MPVYIYLTAFHTIHYIKGLLHAHLTFTGQGCSQFLRVFYICGVNHVDLGFQFHLSALSLISLLLKF